MFLLGMQSAYSQDGPIKLFGKPDSSGGILSIKLNWQNISAGKADTFSIHRSVFAPGVLPSGIPPKYVDVVKDSVFTDKIDKVAGYTYVYQVKARTGKQPLPISNAVTIAFPNIVITPPVLSASVNDSGKVNLIWTAPINFTPVKYILYRSIYVNNVPFNLADAKAVDSVLAPQQKFTDSPAPASYVYFVRAQNQSGGLNSNLAYVKLEVKTENLYLSGIIDSAKVAHLKWSVLSGGVSGKYFVYRYFTTATTPTVDNSSLVLFDSTTNPNYDDASVKLNFGWYAYTIKTKSSGNVPAVSNVVLLKNEQSLRLDNFLLYAALSPAGVKLQWIVPAGFNFSKFYVKRLGKSKPEESTDRKNFVVIDSLGGSATTYVDSLKKSTSPVYSYFVEGLTNDGRTVQSYIANVVIVENIVLSLLPDFDGSLKLSWTKPISSASLYSLVYRNILQKSPGVLDSTGWVLIDTSRNFEWKDYTKNLGNATLVGYRVSVKLASGGSLPSNGVLLPLRPATPEPFTLKGQADKNTIKLQWNPSPFPQTDGYFIYQAKPAALKIDTTLVYTLLDSTKELNWQKTVTANGLDRFFAFYVEARSSANKARTNGVLLVVYKDLQIDEVKIISKPGDEAVVGQQYVYNAVAKSSDSTAKFTWLRGSPVIPGLTLDSNGTVKWTPSITGWIKTYIGVKSSKGGFASQALEIRVSAAKVAKGSIHGTVTDSLGNAISRVVVRLFQRSNTPMEYSAVSDSLGKFSFTSVAVGDYKAFASPAVGNFIPDWYPNVRTADLADKIVVAESSEVAVNFVLKSREFSIPKFNLSGSVNDTVGAGIPGAAVIFARAEFILNAAKHASDSSDEMNYRQLFNLAFQSGLSGSTDGFRFDGLSREIFRTFTDSSGKYTMKLPKGTYIGITFAQGYRRLLYNNKTDLLTADLLRLSTDTTNINFTLSAKPVNVILGGIGGTVTDSITGAGVPSRVIAYRNLVDNRVADAFYVDSDTNGVYSINELPAGQYIVLAIPLGSYAPSFYSTLGTTLKWKNATRIDINGTLLSGMNIFVKPITNRNEGLTFVNGTVVTPLGPSNGNSSMTLQGVNGTIVSVSDANGDVVGYAVTDENGSYSIANLAPGSYTVTADRFGYQSTATVNVAPSYDAQGNSIPASASFTINSDSPTSVAIGRSNTAPSEYRLEQNFPNPFNPSTTIRFAIPQTTKATVAIFNILGQKVATLMDGMVQAGSYDVVWNAGNMASGIYFYQVRTSAFTSTKKMMLLK